MKREEWGPVIWKLLHLLVYRVKDKDFDSVRVPLIQILGRICDNLPCPECSRHALSALKQVRVEHTRTKKELIEKISVIHNMANKRLGKPLFEMSQMDETYGDSVNFKQTVYDYFDIMAKLKTTERMMMYSHRRYIFMSDFSKFIKQNNKYFDI